MGTVRKLTDYYYADFTDEHGRRRRVLAGKTKPEAEVELRRLMVEVDRIRDGKEVRARMDIALTDVQRRYLEDLELRRSPRTVSLHRYALDTVLPHVSAVQVRGLTLGSLKGAIEVLQKRGCSGRTVNIYLGTLRRCLAWAEESGVISRNPIPKIPRLQEVKRRVRRALTDEEIGKLLAASPPDFQLILTTFIETGLRRSELTSLSWRDVDLERGELTVRSENAKTKSLRVIALRRDLVEKLKAWKSRHPSPEDGSPVFINRRGKRVAGDMLNVKLRKTIKASGIKADGVDLHAMRFSFCTRLVKANVSPRIIQALMGHRDLRLISLYADLTLLDRHGAVEALPALKKANGTPETAPESSPDRRAG